MFTKVRNYYENENENEKNYFIAVILIITERDDIIMFWYVK